MAYNDLVRVSYAKLKNISETVKPYNGSKDSFPLGDRRYSFRHFRVAEDGVFDLYLGNREAVNAGMAKKGRGRLTASRAEVYVTHSKVASVHPDNTIEFLATRCGMSDIMFYDGMFKGEAWAKISSRHGGAILRYDSDRRMHPLFRGLRVNLSNFSVSETTDYVSYQPILKRKEADEYMKQFKDFYKSYHVMFDPIPVEAYKEITEDLRAEYPDVLFAMDDPQLFEANWDADAVVGVFADLIRKNRYADAALLSLGLNSPWVFYRIYRSHGIDFNRETVHLTVEKTKHKLIKNEPSLFTFKPISAGEPLPASKWGITTVLKSNNAPVRRL